MKKKFLFIVFCFILILFTSCGEASDSVGSNSPNEPEYCTVSYVTGYDLTMNSERYLKGEKIDLVTLSRPGYEFKGWSITKDATHGIEQLLVVNDCTLYAIWRQVAVECNLEVDFVLNNETWTNTWIEPLTNESKIRLPEINVKPTYYFNDEEVSFEDFHYKDEYFNLPEKKFKVVYHFEDYEVIENRFIVLKEEKKLLDKWGIFYPYTISDINPNLISYEYANLKCYFDFESLNYISKEQYDLLCLDYVKYDIVNLKFDLFNSKIYIIGDKIYYFANTGSIFEGTYKDGEMLFATNNEEVTTTYYVGIKDGLAFVSSEYDDVYLYSLELSTKEFKTLPSNDTIIFQFDENNIIMKENDIETRFLNVKNLNVGENSISFNYKDKAFLFEIKDGYIFICPANVLNEEDYTLEDASLIFKEDKSDFYANCCYVYKFKNDSYGIIKIGIFCYDEVEDEGGNFIRTFEFSSIEIIKPDLVTKDYIIYNYNILHIKAKKILYIYDEEFMEALTKNNYSLYIKNNYAYFLYNDKVAVVNVYGDTNIYETLDITDEYFSYQYSGANIKVYYSSLERIELENEV